MTLDNPTVPITSFLKHDDVITVTSTKVVILPPSRETLLRVKSSAWKYGVAYKQACLRAYMSP